MSEKKPEPRLYYDCEDLEGWLEEVRPGAAAYLARRVNGRGNGELVRLYILRDIEDMRESPSEHAGAKYTIEDLEWLRAEIGDKVSVHWWW